MTRIHWEFGRYVYYDCKPHNHTNVCLFVWGLSARSRMFHSYGDVTITGEGLRILTYARHSWPLSSDGSLACHTYCYTAHQFIMVISEDPLHSHLKPSVWQWSCQYLFLRLMSVATGIRTPGRTRGPYIFFVKLFYMYVWTSVWTLLRIFL